MAGMFKILTPSWHLPGVHACTFLAKDTDGNAVSFDLESTIGNKCRNRLMDLIQPDERIVWLNQIHGNDLVELPLDDLVFENGQLEGDEIRPLADASYTFQSGVVCTVLTADCLPVILALEDGSGVAAIHAGRKGLENGIIMKTVQRMEFPAALYAWIGPGISKSSYPVSEAIKAAFLKNNPDMQHVFKMTSAGDCCMDLYEIARLQLIQAGVDSNRISMAVKNTFTDPDLHSARREGALSGRMATLVWMD